MTFSPHAALSRYRWVAPVPACCLLQALFGFLYASGVFVALLDDPQYTLAVGVIGFFTAVGITIFGIIMNKFIPRSKYREAPVYISVVGSIGIASQLLMAVALATHNTFLLFFGAVLVGLGSGCVYVASIDVLQAWVPETPGMVTGLGMLCGGAGSFVGVYLFRMLAEFLRGPVPSIAVVGVCSGIMSFAASLFVQRPPRNWVPENDSFVTSEPVDLLIDENEKLLPDRQIGHVYPSLRVRDILTDPAFFFLLIAFAASVGPGFGFVLAFQQMCVDVFAVDIDYANKLFLCVTVTGVLGRLFSGVSVDSLQGGSEEKEGLQGARRTNLVLLIAQTTALLSIPYFIRHQDVRMFTVATCVIYVTFSGGAVVAACLVRGIFMPNNSSLAFSLVAISIGCGDLFFSWLVAICGEKAAMKREIGMLASHLHYSDYDLFLFCALLWSILGLIATFNVRSSTKVTLHENQKPVLVGDSMWYE